MALLRRKKDTVTPPAISTDRKSGRTSARKTVVRGPGRYDQVVRPRVTEKAILMSERRVYTFDVFPRASKKDIGEFVRVQYGVEPIAVRIAKKAPKQKFIRGRWGMVAGTKKAYVVLKEGDKIEFA